MVSESAVFALFADLRLTADLVGVALTSTGKWCQENKLKLNTHKTEYVVHGTKSKKMKA